MTDDAASVRAGQGHVEVTGTARVAEQSFTSPLTEQRCVAYRFEKEASLPSKHRDRHEGERRRTTWQTVHTEEAGAPFHVHDGETVSVRGTAVAPEQTPIGSSLDAGTNGPTDPASDGLFGAVKGILGVAAEVPADPRARYKPRAVERLPDTDDDAERDGWAQEVRDTVSTFEGVPEGALPENPDAVQHMMAEARSMSPEEVRVADEAMPDAPALERAQVVVSWGGGDSAFVVSDAV
ncbi:MAG: hypothetical protein V5A30_05165 [Haloarculaceae archaeon]